jgi:hypothetical protein
MSRAYRDGEVLGIDKDGGVIQWDLQGKRRYNCGENLQQFGVCNLTAPEKKRLGLK